MRRISFAFCVPLLLALTEKTYASHDDDDLLIHLLNSRPSGQPNTPTGTSSPPSSSSSSVGTAPASAPSPGQANTPSVLPPSLSSENERTVPESVAPSASSPSLSSENKGTTPGSTSTGQPNTPSALPPSSSSENQGTAPASAPTGQQANTPTSSSSSPSSVGPTVDSVISFCGNGKTKFAVDINTDYYPGNESWELWDACGDEEILAGEFQPEDRDIEYHFETCVDLDARYKFIVKNPVGFENDGPGSPFVLKFDNHIIESRDIIETEADFVALVRSGIVTYFGTKENCCGQEEKNLQVEINSDYYPDETSWKVMNTCTNATVVGGTFDDNQQYYEYAIEKCLKANDTYKFVIEDSNGDGIGYDYDDDDYNDYYYEYDYKVIYDGVQVTAENAQFKDDKDESPNFGSTEQCKSPKEAPKATKAPKATEASHKTTEASHKTTKAPKATQGLLRKRKF